MTEWFGVTYPEREASFRLVLGLHFSIVSLSRQKLLWLLIS
jgi:hypothetical protein